MSCRCGHQFCYACGGDYPNCECLKNAPMMLPGGLPLFQPFGVGGGFGGQMFGNPFRQPMPNLFVPSVPAPNPFVFNLPPPNRSSSYSRRRSGRKK